MTSAFHQSTQFSHWIFDAQEIVDNRSTALVEALGNLPPMEVSSALQEESIALRFFTRQIFVIFGFLSDEPPKLKKRWRLAATSAAYFRRFYAFQSLATYDPRITLLTCIFLAGKSENHFVALRDLKQIYPSITNDEILSSEMVLLECLKFDLKVHHPQNCVHTLLADMKRYQVGVDRSKTSEVINQWLSRCEIEILQLQTTAAVLTHTPLTIATYALLVSANNDAKSLINVEKFFSDTIGAQWAEMKRQHAQLAPFAAEGRQKFSYEQLRAYMVKLKAIQRWNPPSTPTDDSFANL